jgi:hypothetical protein
MDQVTQAGNSELARGVVAELAGAEGEIVRFTHIQRLSGGSVRTARRMSPRETMPSRIDVYGEW